MKLDYNFLDFQTNYKSPSEKFSDGDFSYGDGLIGITILNIFTEVKLNKCSKIGVRANGIASKGEGGANRFTIIFNEERGGRQRSFF